MHVRPVVPGTGFQIGNPRCHHFYLTDIIYFDKLISNADFLIWSNPAMPQSDLTGVFMVKSTSITQF